MDNRTFGYARVSSKEQHEDKQIEALTNFGVSKDNIIVDKCSGKDTEREGYQYLKKQIFRSGDTLVIKELDRLSRNKNEANKKGVTLQYRSCVEVMKEAILRSPIFVGIPNGEDYTVFRNCCVSNHSGQASGYPENYFATIRVEANYLSDIQLYHPMTDAFLYTICGGDTNLIKRHWEYWGYCLSSDARAKIIFFLYGPSGNNGKSTELALQKNLLSAGINEIVLPEIRKFEISDRNAPGLVD